MTMRSSVRQRLQSVIAELQRRRPNVSIPQVGENLDQVMTPPCAGRSDGECAVEEFVQFDSSATHGRKGEGIRIYVVDWLGAKKRRVRR